MNISEENHSIRWYWCGGGKIWWVKIYVEKVQQRHEIKVAFMRTIGASLKLQYGCSPHGSRRNTKSPHWSPLLTTTNWSRLRQNRYFRVSLVGRPILFSAFLGSLSKAWSHNTLGKWTEYSDARSPKRPRRICRTVSGMWVLSGGYVLLFTSVQCKR